MGSSEAREEETIGEPVATDYASRKGRVTPRQLWAKLAAGGKKGKTSKKKAAKKAVTSKAKKKTVVAAKARSEQEVVLQPAAAPEEVAVVAAASKASVPGSPPKMVEPDMQPGTMDYPYATHRTPPEGEEDELVSVGLEKRISNTFVLGVMIIVAALIFGLSMVKQHRKTRTLEQRIMELEQAVPSSNETRSAGR